MGGHSIGHIKRPELLGQGRGVCPNYSVRELRPAS